MASFSRNLLTAYLVCVSLFYPVSTSPLGDSSLAVRDDRTEASRILSSLGAIATAFCSNYLHLKDTTSTALSPGSTSLLYITVPGVAPTFTQSGEVVHVTITPSPNVLQQTQNLPGSTVTSTLTLPALTSTVHITNGGATNLRTSTNPAATNTLDVTIDPVITTQSVVTTVTSTITVATSTIVSTSTVTSTAYTFQGAAKRAATSTTKQAAAPSSKVDGIAGLEKLAASYVSSACSQIARPTTKIVTSRGANVVQTVLQTAAAKPVTITAPASTDTTTLSPAVLTVTSTIRLPDVTVTVNTQLVNVFQTQVVQLPDTTSYVFVDSPPVTLAHTIIPPAITITSTSTSTSTASVTYTTTTTTTTTVKATITNPPGACQQTIYTSITGYGILGQVFSSNVAAANTVECCQKCFMAASCQIYAYFLPGQGQPQCTLYFNGVSDDFQQYDKSVSCPAGVLRKANNGQTNPDPSRYSLNYQGPGPCGRIV